MFRVVTKTYVSVVLVSSVVIHSYSYLLLFYSLGNLQVLKTALTITHPVKKSEKSIIMISKKKKLT